MWEVNKIITCESWEKLKLTAKRYEGMGFKCEVRGWNDIRNNKLTILDDWEVNPDGVTDKTDLLHRPDRAAV